MEAADLNNILGAILEVGNDIQAQATIRQLRADIYNIQNRCGSCSRWMKKSECPREKNKKVSCNELKCSDFLIEPSHQGIVDRKIAEIESLTKTISPK